MQLHVSNMRLKFSNNFKHAAEILKHFQTWGMFVAQTYDLKCHGEN